MSTNHQNTSTGRLSYRRHRYIIRVQGSLDASWSEWFEGMTITTELTGTGAQSLIDGFVADASALYGLLVKLSNLNLTLINVQRAGPDRNTDRQD